jgi:uncharacterized protein YcaQ
MEKTINLTKQQARQFLLSYQELLPPYNKNGKQGVMDFLHRVRCIQFDPLNIVGRNAELVLQSRVDDFKSELLDTLLYEDRVLVDGFDKMMAIYPVEDWPFFKKHRDAMLRYHGRKDRPAVTVMPMVREAIRKRGPLSSIDIKFDSKVDWSWGPTRMSRAALESMYAWGELIVHHKVNTRKFYDFADKHIARELLDAPSPYTSEEDYQNQHILRRLGSVGLMWNRGSNVWLGMMNIKSKERSAAIERLLQRGEVLEITVDGLQDNLYMRCSDEPLLEASLHTPPSQPKASFIAPLDNLLWGRNYIEALFGFKYRWEVYVPVAQREYGYYVLPVLYGDRFIARFEPGWDKKEKSLLIKGWWWEPSVEVSDEVIQAVQVCVARFMRFREAEALHVLPEAKIDWLS